MSELSEHRERVAEWFFRNCVRGDARPKDLTLRAWSERKADELLAPGGVVAEIVATSKAEALREAAAELAVDSSLTDCRRRPTEYADARDDERVDVVIWLRERTDALADERGPA
jgi:hypothetical protein